MQAACTDGPDSQVIHKCFVSAPSSSHIYGHKNAIWTADKGGKSPSLVQGRFKVWFKLTCECKLKLVNGCAKAPFKGGLKETGE